MISTYLQDTLVWPLITGHHQKFQKGNNLLHLQMTRSVFIRSWADHLQMCHSTMVLEHQQPFLLLLDVMSLNECNHLLYHNQHLVISQKYGISTCLQNILVWPLITDHHG